MIRTMRGHGQQGVVLAQEDCREDLRRDWEFFPEEINWEIVLGVNLDENTMDFARYGTFYEYSRMKPQ